MSARAMHFFLLFAMITPALCLKLEEPMVTSACARAAHVDACLTPTPSSDGRLPQLHTLAQMQQKAVRVVRDGVARARAWASLGLDESGRDRHVACDGIALGDCVQLYEDSEHRLRYFQGLHEHEDARTWLSASLTSHRTCLDGLRERNCSAPQVMENLTVLLTDALASYAWPTKKSYRQHWKQVENQGLLASWNASSRKADFVVAKDGSGNYKTINEAVAALDQRGHRRPYRVVIYVKSGVYVENVEIDRDMKNVMFVGDGIDRTIVTGSQNVPDGSTTFRSATFGVSGDGFWARDMTFENTAGPEKQQAVALRVGSDLSVFYRCSFKGYQDTLLLHSQRQFYRDCHVYGTIDFIFGNAAAVLQNCDIYVRRPMGHQANMITAQGRSDPNENTGISVHESRIRPAPDFQGVKGSFETYLGRPWQKFSRTVFMKSNLDGLINPKGWAQWSGNFGLDTLYFGEYMNTGTGASTSRRVKWHGFHVLKDPQDTAPFTVSRFIQGESWIPATGVPFGPGL